MLNELDMESDVAQVYVNVHESQSGTFSTKFVNPEVLICDGKPNMKWK